MKKIVTLLCALIILFTNNYVANAESLQEELARIENKTKDLKGKIDTIESEIIKNDYSVELYDLWENEINSLWSRLSKELTPKTKKKILTQQRAWIKRKDKNSKLIESTYCLTYCDEVKAKFFKIENEINMTRARSYILAKYLAEIRNEKFIIPYDLNKTIHELEPFLDDIFKMFEGRYIADNGLLFGIERSDSCLYEVEGSKWTIWVSDGIILSDKNVYDYAQYYIIFKVSKNGKELFYNLSTVDGWTFSIQRWTSLKELEHYININNPSEENFNYISVVCGSFEERF